MNGKRAKLGDRAMASDRILVDGKVMQLKSGRDQSIRALIYHKPEGQICTRKDPGGRPTIFDNLPAIPGGRWVSVGRLDLNTSGLILLTDSGDLANKLMHPATGLEREYLVRIRGRASDQTIEMLTRAGVSIDGRQARFESVAAADMAEEGTNHWYRIVIKEGRYREVRRMWDAVGHTVSRLKRIRYGTIRLTRDIKQGQFVKMAPMQLEKLVVSANLADEFQRQLYSSGKTGEAKARTKSKSRVALQDLDKAAGKVPTASDRKNSGSSTRRNARPKRKGAAGPATTVSKPARRRQGRN
ncbi:MAG: pseudouridine synthase [Gammaproteobacteria bacterium]|nr:pseudouridine synthase [Gammaproteobacteria bacterium]